MKYKCNLKLVKSLHEGKNSETTTKGTQQGFLSLLEWKLHWWSAQPICVHECVYPNRVGHRSLWGHTERKGKSIWNHTRQEKW